MYFYWGDFYYFLIFIVPVLIVCIAAQIMMGTTYKKYSKVKNRRGLSGAVVARTILDSKGLTDVRIEMVNGKLTDYFDPRDNVVRLSEGNYNGTTISAVGVAAHEVGHAIQYAEQYAPIKLRAAVIPATRFGSWFYFPLFLFGILFQMPTLAYIGVGLFAMIAIFQLITLPVEFNASNRAIKILNQDFLLDSDEILGAKKVLTAAAMTYVAALLMSIVQIIRLILIVRRND
ncbi:MAG: zinc metallopeptidase [Oscillospiraceae bacterium]|nr:zinc metallopeptidase [Oscillospiraceae bacterium]